MNENELKGLALQKEREWKEIQEKRIDALEAALKQKAAELSEEKEKFVQLKEDFKYNLKLLEQRDKELENYEGTYSTLRKQVSDKNAEISELKIKIDEFKKLFEKVEHNIDSDKKHYLSRLNQKQNEIEQYKAFKDSEINRERHEIESLKRNLQLRVNDLEFDLEKQRNELKTEFDECLRKREHEWRKSYDDQATEMLTKELQIKLLNTEIGQLKETVKQAHTTHDNFESTVKQLERKLKEKEWECKDIESIKDAKINELEAKLGNVEIKNQNHNEELIRKFEDMDRSIRDRDSQISKLKDLKAEYEKDKQLSEQKLTETKQQIKQITSGFTEQLNEKDQHIQTLNNDILKLNLTIESYSKTSVNVDLRLSELSQENDKLKKSINVYKAKLNDAVRNDKILEAQKAQLDLEWQQKFETIKNLQFLSSEELIQNLTETNEKTLSHVKQLEQQLRQKENLINVLKTANPALDGINLNTPEYELKEENESLKQIIKQMRDEMVHIADYIPTNPKNDLKLTSVTHRSPAIATSQPSNKANDEFIDDLQGQVTQLKEKNRELQAQIDEFIVKQKLPDKITDNMILDNHMQSLNQTITTLKKDKVELTALTKKQQTRLMFIEKTLNETKEQLRVKQTQIETIQYELSSQTRRYTTEIGALKQRSAEFELQLNETRREADEYHKMSIEKDSEISALELKISDLKLKLSTTGTELNFGGQELFIQELKDEIERLNKKLSGRSEGTITYGQDQYRTVNELNCLNEIDNLKQKLKNAAKHMSQLIKDKQQLIELNNQIRSELNRSKQKNDDMAVKRIADTERLNQNLKMYQQQQSYSDNPLQKLEDMQYDLTKQKLAFEQMKNAKQQQQQPRSANIESISTVRSENLQDIWKILDDNNSIIFKDTYDNTPRSTGFVQPMRINSVPINSKTSKIQNKKSVVTKQQQQPTRLKPRNYNIKDDS